jgi:hypothetical protein
LLYICAASPFGIKLAAQACQAASASASGKGKSPAKSSASSEGSTTEMVYLSQFSVPMKKNWYEDTLYQDAQDPNAELEEYGVTNSGFISGSLLGGILLEVEVAFLAFLPAIFILQKFTGKEVRDGVLASFNIFNFKIKNT